MLDIVQYNWIFLDIMFACRTSRPPVICTKAEVKAKLSLLEVGVHLACWCLSCLSFLPFFKYLNKYDKLYIGYKKNCDLILKPLYKCLLIYIASYILFATLIWLTFSTATSGLHYMEVMYDKFSCSALILLLGWQEWHSACKTLQQQSPKVFLWKNYIKMLA